LIYFNNGAIVTLYGLGQLTQNVTLVQYVNGIAEVELSNGTRIAGVVGQLDYVSQGDPLEPKLKVGAAFAPTATAAKDQIFLSYDGKMFEYELNGVNTLTPSVPYMYL
jgi:hypothetical protein